MSPNVSFTNYNCQLGDHSRQKDMTDTCFHNHIEWVCSHLRKAKHNIRIAMCWFSNLRIFQILIGKLQVGIAVELVIEFDDNNIREGGLDFDHFIQSGGHLSAAHNASLMHHKFAVIDNTILLTGSFNWTNNNNSENMLATDEPTAVSAFLTEFLHLKTKGRLLQNTSDITVKTSAPAAAETFHTLEQLRKNIAGGSKCWVVKLHKKQIKDPLFFQKNQFPFDHELLSQPYYTHYTQFSPNHFENWLNSQTTFTNIQIRYLNTWYRRIRPGDVFLPIGTKNELLGIGVVHAGATTYHNGPHKPVIWIQHKIPSIHLPGQYPIGAPVQYLGSGMQLLQTIFANHP